MKPVLVYDDPLAEVREKILSIIELNPHSYEGLQSYKNALKLEQALVAEEQESA